MSKICTKIKRWYLHRKWVKRQILAWRMACKYYEFEGHTIGYWCHQAYLDLKKKGQLE